MARKKGNWCLRRESEAINVYCCFFLTSIKRPILYIISTPILINIIYECFDAVVEKNVKGPDITCSGIAYRK
ncbi:MAG: hypothetical protein A2Z50_05790 [Nitrospirae bacterium RBG_19FT_COMBO_42_15]|nr:MAG: hypothetical protein A2Z50_05790 [Nitrospirae bacterium RBG_19FT_COMBO_42_15]